MKLQNKVAIVTGGARGIGKAIAFQLANEGASVIITSRSKDEIDHTTDEFESDGYRVKGIVADISQEQSVNEFVSKVINEFSTVHILVNNAGIQGSIGQLAESEIDQWIHTVQTNFIGTYLCSRFVLPLMIQNRAGKIINLAGGGATSSRKNFSAYASSKTAIVRLTEILADEVREFGIEVNAISPGAINTRMTQEVIETGLGAGQQEFQDAKNRILNGGDSPDAAAYLALFLSTHEADGITGKLISAIWDPWREKTFQDLLRSDKSIATLRRIDNKTFYKKT